MYFGLKAGHEEMVAKQLPLRFEGFHRANGVTEGAAKARRGLWEDRVSVSLDAEGEGITSGRIRLDHGPWRCYGQSKRKLD